MDTMGTKDRNTKRSAAAFHKMHGRLISKLRNKDFPLLTGGACITTGGFGWAWY
jgi:hypothetical protein